MTILYFTGTGNSLYLAKRIGGGLLSIPQLIKDNIYSIKDDAVGIIYPCYGFNVPELVADYLGKAHIQAEYTFAIMTYAGDAFGGTQHMEKILSGIGVSLDYTNEIIMPNNYPIGYELTEQLTEKENTQIDTKTAAIVSDIQARKKQRLQKGVVSNFTSAAMRGIMKSFHLMKNADKSFTVNKSCNSCGICKKVCPVKNITLVPNGQPEFHNTCTFCTACFNYCPQNAIHHKREKSNARYHNPHIKLTEIIESNHQYESEVDL